ncbi:MAG: alpha/beta fold hydrolase, partial [Marmoricola sp.]
MNASNDTVITAYAQAPARSVTVGDTTYAYRELGPKGGVPVVFFVHLAATLDNWDPRIVDPIAQHRHVIAFDQRGVGASTGKVPPTLEEAADHAYEFISALGFDQIDAFTFSMGGMIAQDLIVKHPDLVRRLVLTGTGPRGGKDIDKVVGVTYWDILRGTLTRSDPKEFLFFNRDATGKAAGKAFVQRLQQVSGPATAKGVEDTALYVYVPVTSRDEVGAEPDQPLAGAVGELHSANRHRAERWPLSLLATNTHDTKRSADVRA